MRSYDLSKLKRIDVVWIDSESSVGWEAPADQLEKPLTVLSTGFLIRSNRTYITLAADYDPDNKHFNRFIHIPKVNIKVIYEVLIKDDKFEDI